MADLFDEAEVDPRGETATTHLDGQLRFTIDGLTRRRSAEHLAPFLHQMYPGELGCVWLPTTNVYLGKEAGQRIGDLIMTRRKNDAYVDRTHERLPIFEIAQLIEHKLDNCEVAPFTDSTPRQAIKLARSADPNHVIYKYVKAALKNTLYWSRSRDIKQWISLLCTRL